MIDLKFLYLMPQRERASAIFSPDGVLTYSQLRRSVTAAKNLLKSNDVLAGQRVALGGPNNLDYVIAILSLWQMGCIIVPLNTRWPSQLMGDSLRQIGCSVLIDLNDQTERMSVPDIRTQIFSGLSGEFIPDGSDESEMSNVINPDQPASILFTSGSTGFPKAAVHSFANHCYSALGSQKNIAIGEGDGWLLSLPLYHIGGLAIIVRVLLNGATIVVPEPKLPLEKSLDQPAVTHISLVSTQLQRLMEVPAALNRMKRLKAILLGGGPIPHQLVERAFDNGLPIHTSYGSTEMSSQVTTTFPSDSIDRLKTAGRVLPYREISIDNDNEILVRGETLFLGYLEDQQVVPQRDLSGWFHSGDLGLIDEENYLTVLGRKDNQFISGGENIQPEEIERVLVQIPKVIEAMVVPVDDPEFGKRPVAFLKIQDDKIQEYKTKEKRQKKKDKRRKKIPGQDGNIEDNNDTGGSAGITPKSEIQNPQLSSAFENRIRKYLREKLPRFKIPDRFFLWPEEPEQKQGLKIPRQDLQKLASWLIK